MSVVSPLKAHGPPPIKPSEMAGSEPHVLFSQADRPSEWASLPQSPEDTDIPEGWQDQEANELLEPSLLH